MPKKNLIFLAACILVLSTGCQNITPTPSTPNIQSTTQAPPQSVPSKTSTVNTPQPKQLETIESDSEDIMDDINIKDWTKAQTRVNEMKASMSELKPLLQSANVSSSLVDGVQNALTELEKQVTAKKVFESKVQANAITKFIPDIADSYQVLLPTDLGRLDYLGREINLNVENKDWNSANNNFNKGKEIWARLKTKLDTTYKNDIAKYDNSIKVLGDHISKHDTNSTIKETNVLLDKVDLLEKDFSNQKK